MSLIPRPPPFLPVEFTIMEAEELHKPGSIYYMSGCEVDLKGEGRYPNMYAQSSSVFLTSQGE